MNGPVQNRRRFFLVLAPLLLGTIIIPAGRSDAEEEMKVSPTTVAQGLKTIQDASAKIVQQAGADKAAAEKTVGVISPVWSMIEGSIKANSEESYSALENALEELSAAAEAGDTKKAGGAAGAFTSAVNFYVAKFPAGSEVAGAGKAAGSADKPAATAVKGATAERPVAAAPDAAPSGTLARTGPTSALAALAGLAFGLGGLAVMGGAGRRR